MNEQTCSLVPFETGEAVPFTHFLAIGRHPANDLVIGESVVSNRHAVIELGDGAWSIRDLGSRNGTTVNRRRFKGWKALKHGDIICFGDQSRWRFECSGPAPEQAAEWVRTAEDRGRQIPDDFQLILAWEGAEEGRIEVRAQGQVWKTLAGKPFELLYYLAGHPGEWVEDADVMVGVWGSPVFDRSMNIFHNQLYHTRGIFRAWGLGDTLILKQRGRTKLCLRPDQVRREGT